MRKISARHSVGIERGPLLELLSNASGFISSFGTEGNFQVTHRLISS
jgi:hypothetical protein